MAKNATLEKFDYHENSRLKCTKFNFGWGSAPDSGVVPMGPGGPGLPQIFSEGKNYFC